MFHDNVTYYNIELCIKQQVRDTLFIVSIWNFGSKYVKYLN